MKPQMTQIISAEPIEPDIAIIPVGEMNIPEPIILPTTSEMPPNKVIFLSSLTPFSDCIELNLSLVKIWWLTSPCSYIKLTKVFKVLSRLKNLGINNLWPSRRNRHFTNIPFLVFLLQSKVLTDFFLSGI